MMRKVVTRSGSTWILEDEGDTVLVTRLSETPLVGSDAVIHRWPAEVLRPVEVGRGMRLLFAAGPVTSAEVMSVEEIG